ncbi:MAG: Xaa-Pro peptidase family protein [Candidatus Endomicrobiellum trichonymphae]|uniref:M24 family metallopeptidase n=1 Tax=Endomicrobium trichonymphae TaxID=1408204 RepID=UPI0027D39F4D|nr:MAG: Xaa-Pro peptidase family protein [Candidatus Endomicrobium trichonymphae]
MKEKILKKILGKYQTESILFTNVKETSYLTGAEFDGFWLLNAKDNTHIICSKMIENQIMEYFGKQNIRMHTESPLYKTVVKILKQDKINSLLINPKYMNAADFILINENLSHEKINLIKKTGVLDSLRITKGTVEVENLKKACQIVSEVCNTVKEELKPGLSEIDIHYRVIELFAKNRVTESFIPIIASGANSANPHHRSSNRKIIENDIVMMDIGCMYNGYCSDLTRTYFLDKINDKQKKIWNIVKSSQNAVLKEIKAGLPLSWADKTARNIIEAAGYKDKFIHTTGHGVGIEIHEMPLLAPNAEGVFLTHMAVTVEPGIYIEGEFGVRIEDTILIKENGCEMLTSAVY